MNRRPQPRLPFAPLEALVRADSRSALAKAWGVDRSAVSRWAREGMTPRTAERWAVHEGWLPFEVWGDIWDEAVTPKVQGPCPKGHGVCAQYVSDSGRVVCRRCRQLQRVKRRGGVLRGVGEPKRRIRPESCPHGHMDWIVYGKRRVCRVCYRDRSRAYRARRREQVAA